MNASLKVIHVKSKFTRTWNWLTISWAVDSSSIVNGMRTFPDKAHFLHNITQSSEDLGFDVEITFCLLKSPSHSRFLLSGNSQIKIKKSFVSPNFQSNATRWLHSNLAYNPHFWPLELLDSTHLKSSTRFGRWHNWKPHYVIVDLESMRVCIRAFANQSDQHSTTYYTRLGTSSHDLCKNWVELVHWLYEPFVSGK